MSKAKQTVVQEEIVASEIEALDALLEGMDDVVVEEEEVIQASNELEDFELGSEDLDDDTLRSLDADIARAEVYADQQSTVGDLSTTPAAAPVKKVKGKRDASAPRQPRASRGDLTSLPAELFVLEGDIATMTDEDKESAKKITLASRPAQVKIAEKFDNLFQQLAAGKLPSVYVVQGFDLLDTKGTLGMSELIAAFVGAKYSPGTAASQAGQIMALFDTLRIANRQKSQMTVNKGSVIAERLRAAMAASVATA